MNTIHILILFLFGSLWGSFFYTLSLRFSSGMMKESPLRALFSASRCPHCNTRISPIALIPLIGYIFVRGRCRSCGRKISPLYPLVEILFGLLAIGIALRCGISINAAFIFLITGTALTIAYIDIKTLTIPTSLIITMALLSIYPVILYAEYRDTLFGVLFMAGFFLVILLIFPGSFGGGDLKFSSVIGLFAGLEQSMVILEAALISGALIGVIYALKTKKGLRTKIAFAPFLTAGLLLSIFYGREIVLIYLQIMY